MMDKDYHELGIDAADVKRSEPVALPVHLDDASGNLTVTHPGVPTREVGTQRWYLKVGDKVRLRDSERVGEIVGIEHLASDVRVRWEGEEGGDGYYDPRDLVKRA